MGLGETDRRLVVTHEREHCDAGDSTLLVIGLAAIIAVPWNLALWWQLRRHALLLY